MLVQYLQQGAGETTGQPSAFTFIPATELCTLSQGIFQQFLEKAPGQNWEK